MAARVAFTAWVPPRMGASQVLTQGVVLSESGFLGRVAGDNPTAARFSPVSWVSRLGFGALCLAGLAKLLSPGLPTYLLTVGRIGIMQLTCQGLEWA